MSRAMARKSATIAKGSPVVRAANAMLLPPSVKKMRSAAVDGERGCAARCAASICRGSVKTTRSAGISRPPK